YGVSRSLALRLRKREIEPGRQLPGRAVELGGFGKEGMPDSRQAAALASAVFQNLLQEVCLPGGGTHSLSVNRIEGAKRITDDQQSVRKSGHRLVVTLYTHWKSMMRNRSELLGVFYNSPGEVTVQPFGER